MDHYEFAREASRILDFLCEYKLGVDTYDVIPELPITNLVKTLPKTIPDDGESFDTIFEDFKRKILPSTVNWNHPFNFSCYPNPNSFPSILGDMLSTGFGGIAFSWKSCPALTELESLMIDWYAQLLDLPDCFLFSRTKGVGGGSYQESNSDAIYNIILAARCKAVKQAMKLLGISEDQAVTRLVAYASMDSHLCIKRFCEMEYITYRAIKTDNEGSMSISELANSLQRDKENGLIPLLVVATIGTFLKFGVDNVAKIRSVLQDYPTAWLHADGGYGGNAMLLKRFAHLRDGLQNADSFSANPHKWLQMGCDVTTLWLQKTHEYQMCFVINPVYLQNDNPEAIDFRHYGIALSRKFRALKMWMTFRLYGKSELELRIRKSVDLADKFATKLSKLDNFEVIHSKFTFVNFVLRNRSDSENMDLYNKILKTGKLLLMGVRFEGKFTLRFSPTYEYTKEKHIDRAISIIKGFAL